MELVQQTVQLLLAGWLFQAYRKQKLQTGPATAGGGAKDPEKEAHNRRQSLIILLEGWTITSLLHQH